MREDSTMRKITRSKHPEKRRNTKWNASGSTLAMNRQVVDTETVVYAMMCAMIASLILSSILPMVCNAAGDFSSCKVIIYDCIRLLYQFRCESY